MTIEKHNALQVQELEDRIRDVANQIGRIRREMQEHGLAQIDLETNKAVRYLDYLHDVWANRSYARVKEQLAKNQVQTIKDKKKRSRK